MLLGDKPYFTYKFGSMGQTLDTARSTGFFQWFHLEETERRVEEPGEIVRFRPSGDKFRDLCYLDTLIAGTGEIVRMELVVRRSFIDGRDASFAQDLVKSFLRAALTDACRNLLRDFLQEIDLTGGRGPVPSTPGYLVYRGQLDSWKRTTGWSRIHLANLSVSDTPSFVIHLGPNPKAPNARRIGEDAPWYERWRSANWLPRWKGGPPEISSGR